MEKSDRIRFVRTLMGLTRTEMERHYNVKSTSLEKWECGKNNISLKSATQLAQIAQQNGINCYSEWILFGEGDKPTANPNHQKKKITDVIEEENVPDSELIIRDMLQFKKNYPAGDILLVTDDSMYPQFSVGDYVGGLPILLETLKNKLDHAFIVQTEDGKKRLRRITRKGTVYTLYGINLQHSGTPVFEVDVKIKKAYTVFWHRLKIDQ